MLGSTATELLPPEAQVHLLNAQRELLLALKATLEHHTGQARTGSRPARRRRPVKVDLE